MGYDPVSQDSSDGASETQIDDVIVFSGSCKRTNSLRSLARQHWLSIVNLVLLSVQFTLLTWHINSISPACNNTPDLNTAFSTTSDGSEVQFGRNYEYMTLDHTYDAVWQGHEIDTGGYIVVSEHGGRFSEKSFGAVSM